MKRLNNKLSYVLYLVLASFLFAGCADVEIVTECVIDTPYGFWSGLWHGMIAPFAWIGSLFSDDIAIYAVNNNGGWYDFGFILGIGSLSSSSASAAKR